VQSSSPPNVGQGLLTAALIALAIIAIMRSPSKWRTLGFIVVCVAAGLAVGILIGLALGGAGAAGTLGGLCMQVAGIAASINRMIAARRPKPQN